MEKNKSYIWSLPTRLFHWLFVVGIVSAYFLGEDETLSYHISFGFMVGVLLLFRLLWGFIGPRYSTFSDFPIMQVFTFLKASKDEKRKFVGHNPAASIVMILLIICGLCVVISGILNLSVENSTPLSFSFVQQNGELFEELHEVFVNILIALIGLHLAGILIDTISEKKKGSLVSIFTGYKAAKASDIQLNNFQKIYSFIWILFSAITFIYIFNISSNLLQENEQMEELENHELNESSEENH